MRPENRDLYHADTLQLMERLDGGLFTLVYLDPPWGHMLRNPAEISEYRLLFSRIVQQAWRVLADDGSLYVQLPSTSQSDTDYRLLLNQCVGRPHSYVITWKYPLVTNAPRPRETHEEILRYNRTSEAIHNIIERPTDLTQYRDADDRGPYRLCDITTPLRNPSRVYEWHGHLPPQGRAWMFPLPQMEQYFADGRILETGRGPRMKRYADEATVQDIGTIWDDIPIHYRRRARYPGAKPPELCRRIIQQATNENSWILDPMCGSGQMLLQAEALGRPWCGCDAAADAIELTQRQFAELEPEPGLLPGKTSEDALLATGIVWAEYEDVFLSITEVAGARRKLAKLSEFMTALKTELKSDDRSDDEIMEAMQQSIPALRWLMDDRARSAGDERVRAECRGFDQLDSDSQDFLVTAHAALDILPEGFDFSMVSVSAWKTIENEIGDKIFSAFKYWVAYSELFAAERFQKDEKGSPPRRKLVAFCRGKGKPFTLGELGSLRGLYNKAPSHQGGRSIADALRGFIDQTFAHPEKIVGEHGLQAMITSSAVKQYRNGAAHDSLFTRQQAEESLQFVLGLFPTIVEALQKKPVGLVADEMQRENS